MRELFDNTRYRTAANASPVDEVAAREYGLAEPFDAPLAGTERRTRRRLALVFAIGTLLIGGGLSVMPRPNRVVTREVIQRDGRGGTGRQMELQERSYGIPFRTWIVSTGPARENVQTYTNVRGHPSAVVFNILAVALAGLALLGLRRNRPQRPPP